MFLMRIRLYRYCTAKRSILIMRRVADGWLFFHHVVEIDAVSELGSLGICCIKNRISTHTQLISSLTVSYVF